MAKAPTPADVAETEAVDYTTIPGSHVLAADGSLLGTYTTPADAEMFVEQQLPADSGATIVTGS